MTTWAFNEDLTGTFAEQRPTVQQHEAEVAARRVDDQPVSGQPAPRLRPQQP